MILTGPTGESGSKAGVASGSPWDAIPPVSAGYPDEATLRPVVREASPSVPLIFGGP